LKQACEDRLQFLLMAQGISSAFGSVFVFPVAEQISAYPTYLHGLRELARVRLNMLVKLHLGFDCGLFALTLSTVVAASNRDPKTCDSELVDAVTNMLSFVQGPVLAIRFCVHALLPMARVGLDRAFDKQYGHLMNPSDLVRLGSDGANALSGGDKARKEGELAVSRIKADLDINFHEYQGAFTERRRVRKGKLVRVEESLSAAGRAYKGKQKELVPESPAAAAAVEEAETERKVKD